MKITTCEREVGLIVDDKGGYELTLFSRASNRLIRFPVDAALAWAISGTIAAPITSTRVTNPATAK